MALFEFKLPDLGEGVAEGEVVAWHVQPGQLVREDQDLVEVMTDKATVTIGAPKAGRIAHCKVGVGERVRVGSVLVVIDTGASGDVGERAASARAESEPPSSRESEPRARLQALRTAAGARREQLAASAVGDLRESLPGASFFARGLEANGRARPAARELAPARGAGPFFAEKPLATPATRKLARDLGVDLREVPPSGPGGRVTKADLCNFSGVAEPGARAQTSDFGSAELAATSEARAARTSQSGASESPRALSRERRTPFVGMRRRIAERMQLSRHKAAHFTFVEEVDVAALKGVVERLRPAGEKLGVKVQYLPFIVKAVTLALKKHPALNSMLDEQHNELVYRDYYHIGIATATEQGLLVPVLRDADQKSPLEIAREIQRLAAAARAGELSAQELSGSTFTITSLGRMGGLLATPVLNYPEVGILGVHRVKERPVVRGGEIAIGQVMLLSLSFDHRIIDGHVGAAFAYDVIAYLEQPELLLLELA